MTSCRADDDPDEDDVVAPRGLEKAAREFPSPIQLCVHLPEDTSTGTPATFEPIRRATVEEGRAVLDTSSRLLSLTEHSGYMEVQLAGRDLTDAIEFARDQGSQLDAPRRNMRAVERAFRAWLAAVRSLDDHTCNWLAEEFGHDSAHKGVFRTELRSAYDINFAYRLACTLRNASLHSGAVVNHFSVVASRPFGARESTVRVEAGFDGPRLVAQHPELKQDVRNSLQECRQPLDAVAVCRLATAACERAHAALLLSLRDALEPAMRVVEALDEEARLRGGMAIFIPEAMFQTRPADISTITLYENPVHLARRVRRNFSEAASVLAKPGLVVDAEDLLIVR